MAARRAATLAAERAPALDQDGAFPEEDVADLHRLGLLAAPVPAVLGGQGLGSDRLASPELLSVLRLLGSGNLGLGRLYEGHVNAWRLIAQHGSSEQRHRLAADTRAGLMLAVWNTGPSDGLWLDPDAAGFRLRGVKTFASGAGFIARPLATARTSDGQVRMVVVPLTQPNGGRADLSAWQAQGMRASASGRFDFTGLKVSDADLIGQAGGYEHEPDFTAGAWRFAAVHLGGIDALVAATIAHLRATGRGDDPHQRSRLGRMAIAAETAHLWLERVAAFLGGESDPDRLMSYVRLARLAVEQAGLDVLELAQRSIGVQAFLRPHPVERLGRDLATYLRQPAPDQALVAAAGSVLAEGSWPWR